LTVSGYIRMECSNIAVEIPVDLIALMTDFYKIVIESNILFEKEAIKLYDMICNELKQKQLSWTLIYRGTRLNIIFVL